MSEQNYVRCQIKVCHVTETPGWGAKGDLVSKMKEDYAFQSDTLHGSRNWNCGMLGA